MEATQFAQLIQQDYGRLLSNVWSNPMTQEEYDIREACNELDELFPSCPLTPHWFSIAQEYRARFIEPAQRRKYVYRY